MVSSAPIPTRFLAWLLLAVVAFQAATAIAQEEAATGGRAADPPETLEKSRPEPPPLERPATDPPTLRIPDNLDADLPPGGDERIPDKIRDALQQRGGDAETGDAILDGVLDAIRRRGSILDGSLLDPTPEDGDRPAARGGAEPQLRPLPEDGIGGAADELERSPSAVPYRRYDLSSAEAEAQFELAEQLLKTARLLAADGGLDPARRRLIAGLRSEAARILAALQSRPGGGGAAPAGYDEATRPF